MDIVELIGKEGKEDPEGQIWSRMKMKDTCLKIIFVIPAFPQVTVFLTNKILLCQKHKVR